VGTSESIHRRKTDPLHLHFETTAESLWPGWARPGVSTVGWRPVATFTLQPDAPAWPLALSAGGSCLSFDRTLRRLSFESLPIAVCGHHGAGRFALFGGPHLFESSPLGLLAQGDNTRFLHNTLGWLLSDAPEDAPPPVWRAGSSVWPGLRELSQVEADGNREGERTAITAQAPHESRGRGRAPCARRTQRTAPPR
jgi:hypothetical protein